MRIVSRKSFFNKLLNSIELKFRRRTLLSKPISLSIEPTLQCNSACKMCNRYFNAKKANEIYGFFDIHLLEKIIPFIQSAEEVIIGGFGESLLHPDFLKLARIIKSRGPYLYFFTNGISLNETLQTN